MDLLMDLLTLAIVGCGLLVIALITLRPTRLPALITAAVWLVAVLVWPTFAAAQTALAAADLGPSWAELIFYLVSAILVGFVIWALHRFLGLKLDAQAQNDLHRALSTGAAAFWGRHGLRSTMLDTAAPAFVVNYARLSVPGALRRLSPSDDILDDLATAKLREVVGAAVAPGPAGPT